MLRMRWRICPIFMTQSIKGHANCSYPGVLLYVTTISVLFATLTPTHTADLPESTTDVVTISTEH